MELRFPHFTWSSETLIPIAGFKSHVYIVTTWATTIEIIQKDIFKNTVRCNHKKCWLPQRNKKWETEEQETKETNNEMADLNPNISIIILNISGLNTSTKW